eukprot:Rhum_TRINITY_DN10579_c0_g1::Rhum_TRINITY_DN10579_c0_g1_i1::g.39100::m.39100
MSSPPSPAAAAESYDSVMRALDVGTPCRLVKTASTAAAASAASAAPQGVVAAAVRARDAALEARVIDAALLAERTRVRDGWGAVDAAAFEAARSVADPLLRVKHTSIPFRTRAALKLADIDQEAALVSVQPAAAGGGGGGDDDDDDTFYFEDLCGAPGSWTEYVLWALNVRGFLPAAAGIRGTAAKGWGYSLSTDNPLLDWQLEYFNKTARAGASRLRREALCFRG